MLFPSISGLVLLLVSVGWLVPHQSWWRALWVLLPAIPGWGLLLDLLEGCVVTSQFWRRARWGLFSPFLAVALGWLWFGWVVPRQSWQRAPWVLVTATPG